MRHLNGVRVAQLMRREPAPHPRRQSSPTQLLTRRRLLPLPPRGRTEPSPGEERVAAG
jgi:hypothetical protein